MKGVLSYLLCYTLLLHHLYSPEYKQPNYWLSHVCYLACLSAASLFPRLRTLCHVRLTRGFHGPSILLNFEFVCYLNQFLPYIALITTFVIKTVSTSSGNMSRAGSLFILSYCAKDPLSCGDIEMLYSKFKCSPLGKWNSLWENEITITPLWGNEIDPVLGIGIDSSSSSSWY